MLVQADARHIPLGDGSIHTVITSPPYWRLRNYGTNPLIWGGDGSCDHIWEDSVFCVNCGAWMGELGLESTPELYVQHIVEIFCEIRRVLRHDGVVWLNIGDSYYGGKGRSSRRTDDKHSVLKPKDLCMIPYRVAIALQENGWWVRSDIVWAKGVSFRPDFSGSTMPESVNNRPTKSHEYVFLLSRSKDYYYDAEAVKEEGIYPAGTRAAKGSGEREGNRRGNEYAEYSGKRNLRSVWAINPKPYSEAHFAIFPPSLVEPMVLASTSEKGCCPKCGSPYERITAKEEIETPDWQPYNGKQSKQDNHFSTKRLGGNTKRFRAVGMPQNNPFPVKHTVGWQSTCSCNAGDPVPCTVLDPFSGTATVGIVAIKHKRNYIGLEIKWDYIELARKRMNKIQLQLI